MMNNITSFLSLIIFFTSSLLSAQTFDTGTTTRAVVVGISDYQDPAIPDLRFADRDAEAFTAWLQSPAGGNVPSDQIQLLLNDQATKGKVAMALTWLYQQSQEGDRAVIYFSGHGDVEKKLFNQPGYLLCRDAPSVVYMSGGTLSVTELQEVVATLSMVNKARVLVITDACRVGALAGSATGGPQQTTASLMNSFANEIKILSCQSNEYSIEGEQWGGGRGAFSYVLEDALNGMADRDKDNQIKLKEIGHYLEDQVPIQTDPQVQNPVVLGDREAWVASVDEKILTQWESEKKRQQSNFSSGDMRGIYDLILAQADTNIQEIYQSYLAAVEASDLMKAAGSRMSANECYEILINEPSIEQLHGFLKRDFVAALVDEAQVVTNKLLKTDPNVISDARSRPFVFDHISDYLGRAVDILGEKHFLYKQLKAKQYFFEAKTCLPEYFPGMTPDSVAQMAVKKFEEALHFDSNAAYIHVEFGFLLDQKLFERDNALAHAEKALELSPNWVYAHFLAGICNFGDTSKVFYHLRKALDLDSTFLAPYWSLSQHYDYYKDKNNYTFYRERYIQKAKALLTSNPDEQLVYYRILLGSSLWLAGRIDEAEEVLLKAEELSKGQALGVYQYLGALYIQMERWENALRVIKRQLELAPSHPQSYFQLVACYKVLNQPLQMVEILEKAVSQSNIAEDGFIGLWLLAILGETYNELQREREAKEQFQKIHERLPDLRNAIDVNFKGRAWLGLGDLAAMQRTIDEGLRKFPGDVIVHYQAACLYSLANDEKKSLEWIELAIEKGFDDVTLMKTDYDLYNIRSSPGFKALMRKYFPDQVKD